jgi:hypothetical protein
VLIARVEAKSYSSGHYVIGQLVLLRIRHSTHNQRSSR